MSLLNFRVLVGVPFSSAISIQSETILFSLVRLLIFSQVNCLKLHLLPVACDSFKPPPYQQQFLLLSRIVYDNRKTKSNKNQEPGGLLKQFFPFDGIIMVVSVNTVRAKLIVGNLETGIPVESGILSLPTGIGLRCNHSIGRRDSSDLVC